jgi:hypothetical protein
VTFRPDYPLFAGHYYYIQLANIEDLAGNKLSRSYSFSTAYAPDTDPNALPNAGTIVASPDRLYADGKTTAIVEISNINRDRALVPNGTKIAVTAEPTGFGPDSAGGAIGGGLVSGADSRFKIFTTLGGKVTLTYQSANLSDLVPTATRNAYIQVVSVDAAERPVSLIGKGQVLLYQGFSAKIDVNPFSILSDGNSYAEVEIQIFGYHNQPIPPGTRVGITAEPFFRSNSLGGTIQGGEVAPDNRIKLFRTITGGMVKLNYISPALAPNQSGKAWIQVVEVDDAGRAVGLIGEMEIWLSGSEGDTAPQPRPLSISPWKNQTGVGLNVPVVVEFSHPLDPAKVTPSFFSIRKSNNDEDVSGSLSLKDGVRGTNTILTFVPDHPWSPNTRYTVKIDTEYYYGVFTTGTTSDDQAPYVVKVNPPAGVTGVAINSVISVEFSEPMSPSTINGLSFRLSDSRGSIGGRIVADRLKIFSFIPDSLLAPDTIFSVTIDANVADLAGNLMTSAFTSNFTTQSSEDNYPPRVETVNPPNEATEIPANTTIRITFSEPMNSSTINEDNCFITGPNDWDAKVPSTIILSGGNTQVTLTPTQPLFAGRNYYVHATTSVMDMAGNNMATIYNRDFSSGFTTSLAPGTFDLPTGATAQINPKSVFANGDISTTVIISNINRNGTPVPNGTLIGVTAEPAFAQNSVGGVISGNSVGTSPDSRFSLFSTEGASVTVYYTPPDLDWLTPGATASGIIQVASVDLDTRPVSLIAQGAATLFRMKTATMTADPTTLPADGTSLSNVEVIVRDNLDNLVPDGTEVGITVEPIFVGNTAGGTIIGGTPSSKDSRVKIFSTAGGRFTFSYRAPSDRGPGYGSIQAVTVDREGYPTGLISTINITLRNP